METRKNDGKSKEKGGCRKNKKDAFDVFTLLFISKPKLHFNFLKSMYASFVCNRAQTRPDTK